MLYKREIEFLYLRVLPAVHDKLPRENVPEMTLRRNGAETWYSEEGAEKVFSTKKAKFLYFEIGVRLVVVMGRGETTFFFPTNFLSQRPPPW